MNAFPVSDHPLPHSSLLHNMTERYKDLLFWGRGRGEVRGGCGITALERCEIPMLSDIQLTDSFITTS
jgi:hypothetical protein